MAEYKRDGILLQGFAENDTRIGYRAGNTAFADYFQLLDIIGPVEIENGKYFMPQVAETGLQDTGYILAAFDQVAGQGSSGLTSLTALSRSPR